ncbi:Core Histone Macro-H2A.1 [Manis pentadactyla]|nr:Core Histone Macro-H2A.1 [Manis pentadactyla]
MKTAWSEREDSERRHGELNGNAANAALVCRDDCKMQEYAGCSFPALSAGRAAFPQQTSRGKSYVQFIEGTKSPSLVHSAWDWLVPLQDQLPCCCSTGGSDQATRKTSLNTSEDNAETPSCTAYRHARAKPPGQPWRRTEGLPVRNNRSRVKRLEE